MTVPLLIPLVIASTTITAAPIERSLEGPSVHATLGGGHIDSFRLDPRDPGRVAATFRSRAFVRTGPGAWEEAPTGSASGWPVAPSAGVFRRPTGEVVHRAVELPGDVIVGATDNVIVESTDRFATAGQETTLPITAVLAAAADPAGTGAVLAAGDPTGLFHCAGAGDRCKREAPGRFSAVAWYLDGTRLAADAKGGMWRHDGTAWERRQLAEPVTEITGVPDGGPRYAHGTSGQWYKSEDHGLTWERSDAPAGRLGSGGMIARRTEDGALEVVGLDKQTHPLLEPGLVPQRAPLRWASPDLVVVGLADGVLAVERTTGVARRLMYPDGQKRPFFDAVAAGDKLSVYAGREALLRFQAPTTAGWSAERLASSALEGIWWVIGLVTALAILVFWINRKLKTS